MAVSVSVGVGVAVAIGVAVAVSVGVGVALAVTTTTADSVASGSATTLVSRRENTSAEARRNSIAVRVQYFKGCLLSRATSSPTRSVVGPAGRRHYGARPICHPRPAVFGLRQALRPEWYNPALLDINCP